MCNFYDAHLPGKRQGYLSGAKLNLPKDYESRHKVYPKGLSPIAYINKEGELVMELSHFKLVPYFADDLDHKYSTMNARDDKLKEKSMWVPYFEKKRCLVPVSAFYEHHTLPAPQLIEGHDKPTNKVPFRIGLKSSDVFCFAGLYNKWIDPETGEEKLSHAIITTDPNDTLAKIHNSSKRMAVILPETAYDSWVNPIVKPESYFDEGLIQPWPDEDMDYFQITKNFDYGVSDEQLLKAVEKPIDI